MKRFLSLVMIMIVFTFLCITAIASEDIKVVLDEKEVNFTDAMPIIINNRTMVPMRMIFETLDPQGQIVWDDSTKEVTALCQGKLICLTIENPVATVDNKEVKLDSPPVIVNNRTMVPLRFIAESTGASVEWDDSTRTVIIQSSGIYTKTVFFKENPSVPSVENVTRIPPNSIDIVDNKTTYTYKNQAIDFDVYGNYMLVLDKNGFTSAKIISKSYSDIYSKGDMNVGINMDEKNFTLIVTVFQGDLN